MCSCVHECEYLCLGVHECAFMHECGRSSARKYLHDKLDVSGLIGMDLDDETYNLNEEMLR